MTTTPVSFYGINAAPPFNGPLTISETTPGDVNTASFFDASNNPVNQGFQLGQGRPRTHKSGSVSAAR
jgi:hypothetical protein